VREHISPRRHWPQKAMLAAAAMAASAGSLMLRLVIREISIERVTGGRKERRDEMGVIFLTPLRTRLSRGPPSHLAE
jgi:hypothetical protein